MQIVRMLKTLSPAEVPNATIGVAYDDVTTPGLHRAMFNGYTVFVYGNEVELVLANGPARVKTCESLLGSKNK